MKTALVITEERRRWDRVSMAKKKRAKVKSGEDVLDARGKVTQEAVAAWSRQKDSVVVIGDSVATASEVALGATLADVMSVQVPGDVGCQLSTRDAEAHQMGKMR